MKQKRRRIQKTTVGAVDSEVLAFTVGRDPRTDLDLAEDDCAGTAAHVVMLSRMRVSPPVISAAGSRRVIAELARIAGRIRAGSFRIRAADQDVHMAIERELASALGALGRKVHTGRSRNDQVATDLRLYARRQLLFAIEEAAALAKVLLRFARKHKAAAMVGRTHMQPAMTGSVGLWASAYAESLLDDMGLMEFAYAYNDRSPLGAGAGYGVPLPIDRKLTARLLGFGAPCHNVLHAINARGKCESVALFAMAQAMLTLSRLAADCILYGMPEFGYFTLPPEYCTGSSIMPQKRNPDAFELVRAKAATVMSAALAVAEVSRGLPGGYSRDLQETKHLFVSAFDDTRASLRVCALVCGGMKANVKALERAFVPGVFAADRALELAASGVPFRDAYDRVKAELSSLKPGDARRAMAAKRHLGAPAGIDFAFLGRRARAAAAAARRERRRCAAAISRLMGGA